MAKATTTFNEGFNFLVDRTLGGEQRRSFGPTARTWEQNDVAKISLLEDRRF